MNINNLLKPQIPHVKKLIDSIYLNGFALDLSQTGMGKTFCAASVASNTRLPVVVVCPKIARKTWIDTLAMFDVEPMLVINYEKLIRGNTQYYTYNKQEFVNAKEWYLSQGIKVNFPKNCLIIIDEVHKAKAPKSLSGKMLTALKNNGHKLLMLSATAASSVADLRHIGYATNLHDGKGFHKFAKEHGAVPDGYGSWLMSTDTELAKTGMVKIHDTLFNQYKCASRMNLEDFGDIFPENHIVAESFDLGEEGSAKLEAVYARMEKELAVLDERASNYKEHVFAIMMFARRQSELLKVEVITEWITDGYDAGISPVVFFNFTESLQAVEQRLSKLGSQIIKVVGGMTETIRQGGIDEFQADKKRIALLNSAAGNCSLSLHDINGKYPRNSLICPSWSPTLTLQMIGRIYRAKGLTKCLQKFLFATEIEERQRLRVHGKVQNISQLTMGDLSLSDKVNLFA